MKSKIEQERLLVEHLSNPNSWCYYNVTTLLGLRYIQYKHIYLSLIAEQEEGDDFFFVYYYIQKYGTDFIDSTKEPIFIRIKSIGFKYVNNVNICNQKK